MHSSLFTNILPCKFHSPWHSQTAVPVSLAQWDHCHLPAAPLLYYNMESTSGQKPMVIISFTLFHFFKCYSPDWFPISKHCCFRYFVQFSSCLWLVQYQVFCHGWKKKTSTLSLVCIIEPMNHMKNYLPLYVLDTWANKFPFYFKTLWVGFFYCLQPKFVS